MGRFTSGRVGQVQFHATKELGRFSLRSEHRSVAKIKATKSCLI